MTVEVAVTRSGSTTSSNRSKPSTSTRRQKRMDLATVQDPLPRAALRGRGPWPLVVLHPRRRVVRLRRLGDCGRFARGESLVDVDVEPAVAVARVGLELLDVLRIERVAVLLHRSVLRMRE